MFLVFSWSCECFGFSHSFFICLSGRYGRTLSTEVYLFNKFQTGILKEVHRWSKYIKATFIKLLSGCSCHRFERMNILSVENWDKSWNFWNSYFLKLLNCIFLESTLCRKEKNFSFIPDNYWNKVFHLYTYHGTVTRTWITGKKISYYIGDSACRWLIFKMLKYFEIMLNIFEFSRVKENVESWFMEMKLQSSF